MYNKNFLFLNCYNIYRFEEQNGFVVGARSVFEKAVEFFGDEHISEILFIAFARFEERQKEVEEVLLILYEFLLKTFI